MCVCDFCDGLRRVSVGGPREAWADIYACVRTDMYIEAWRTHNNTHTHTHTCIHTRTCWSRLKSTTMVLCVVEEMKEESSTRKRQSMKRLYRAYIYVCVSVNIHI